MIKKPAAILILSGIAMGTVALSGYRYVSRHTGTVRPANTARVQEPVIEVARQTDLATLRKQPLAAPSVCDSIRTGVFFDICQHQPIDGQLPMPWDIDLNDYEEECVLEAFHATNRQVLRLRQRDYLPEPPSDLRVIHFACDVVTATFKTENCMTTVTCPRLLR